MTPTGYVYKYAYDPGGGSRTALLWLHSANEADDGEDAHEGHSSGTAKGGPAGSKKKFPKQNKAILEMLRSSLSHGQHSEEYPPFGANLTGVDLYDSIITDVAERQFNCNVTHFMARTIVNVEFGAQRTKYMDSTESWDERGPRIGDFRNLASRQREQYVHVDHSIEGCDKRLGTYKPPSIVNG